jgi:hypothetical protein
MRALRWLEIEIEDDDISRDARVNFCMDLGQKLSEISERRIEVLFAEKLGEEVKTTKQEEMTLGQPGDDYIWALDS